MKVLLIGSGGREHALAWKLSQSELVTELVCAPGNAGIAEVADIAPVAADDIIGLLALVQRDQYDFVIVGPEQPLALGLVDALQDLGVKVFGPTEAGVKVLFCPKPSKRPKRNWKSFSLVNLAKPRPRY